ncbi:sigma-70 family RNA polymerase sigma factor [Marinilactibacillus kalidii]|uniref:sigma-70 family RNA polymerase sigma factor n=1 Tax=Marinilactibacillus kalidii TaxID=2820274 RepID=UPI001FC9CD96|nr:FliA/WhiG family RNA polymerase sigma factor [Marinilactibacillus kalidii]
MKVEDRNQTVIQYMPLVHKVVHNINIKNKDYDHEDMVNIGVIGLMDALDRYDETQKVPFENYAYIRIKGAIIDEIRKTSRVPRSRMAKLNTYYKAKEELELEFRRNATEAEVCQKLGLTKKDLEGIHDTVHQLAYVSLDEVINVDSDNEVTILDALDDQNSPSLDNAILKQEQSLYLSNAVDKLSEREKQMLQLIYVERLSMKEVAFIFDISIPRVSQIHGKTLLKLRENLESDYAND